MSGSQDSGMALTLNLPWLKMQAHQPPVLEPLGVCCLGKWTWLRDQFLRKIRPIILYKGLRQWTPWYAREKLENQGNLQDPPAAMKDGTFKPMRVECVFLDREAQAYIPPVLFLFFNFTFRRPP